MNLKDFMNSFWRHLPETINPIAFTVGFFSLYWYAVFFLGGVLGAWLLARFWARRGMAPCAEEEMFDVLLFLFCGALVGGRIGYVLFYNFDLFLGTPLAIISPYDFQRSAWTGISGMSYHGGLIGATAALYWWARTKNIPFWNMADFVALLVPVATFFGRLGNFFNVELSGRVTTEPWGMLFPAIAPRGVLRHPSTLYEAFLEGIVLFVLMMLLRKKMPFSGALACVYIAGYASARFLGEYFRAPDEQLGLFAVPLAGELTAGQLFSVGMLGMAGVIFVWLKHQNHVKLIQKK
ncbi:MAG: prolipoprotein diacylglyceryl transferase [Candidatus Moraniibacteriota bacterium]